MNSNSLFEEYPGLGEFVNNMKKKHPEMKHVGMKNLYVIRSEDQDGNIVDEKYGMNLITDAGFDHLRRYHTWYSGSSEGTRWPLYAFSDAELVTPTVDRIAIYGGQILIAETITKSNANYAISYDSDSGFMSQALRLGYYTFDYNQGSFTEDKLITRFEIPTYTGTTYQITTSGWSGGSAQWFSGLEISVYDGTASPSNIYKRPNQKLTVYVFIVVSIDVSVITTADLSGIYSVFSPNLYFPRNGIFSAYDVSMQEMVFTNRLEGYSDYDQSGSWSGKLPQSIGITEGLLAENNTSDNSNIMDFTVRQQDSVLIIDKRQYVTRSMIYKNDSTYGNGMIFTREQLSSPEELTSDIVYTNSTISPLLTNTFGKYKINSNNQGVLPVVDFDISQNGVKGYNYNTHDWDIDVPFVNAPSTSYDNTTNHGVGISIEGKGWCVVYINALSNVNEITALKTSNGGIPNGTISATDAYWDTTSWISIPDPTNVPSEAKNCRYWIIQNGTFSGVLEPVYSHTEHALNVGTSHTLTNVPSGVGSRAYACRTITSQTKGWILYEDHLLFMDDTTNDIDSSYRLYGSSDTTKKIDPLTFRYGFDDYVVVAEYHTWIPNNVRIYDIDGIINGDQDPYVDVPITFTSYNRFGHYSSSRDSDGNGYVIIQHQSEHKAYILDVTTLATTTGATPTLLTNVDLCTAIDETEYCVYCVTSTDPAQFVIYDMKNNTTVRTFTLPSGYNTTKAIIGLRDLIWIRDGSNSTETIFLYDIDEDYLTSVSGLTFGNLSAVDYDVSKTSSNSEVRPWAYRVVWRTCHDGIIVGQDNNHSSSTQDGWFNWYIKYNVPKTRYAMFKTGYYNEQDIDGSVKSKETYNSFELGVTSQILETSDHKHLLLIDPSSFILESYRPQDCDLDSDSFSEYGTSYSSHMFRIVTDLGYLFDRDPNIDSTRLNECPRHSKTWNDYSVYTYNAMAYWNNGIIVFGTNGTCTWCPLDWYLPHRVTGTTYTIQCYNNPKLLTNKHISVYLSNRGPWTDPNYDQNPVPSAPQKLGGCVWIKDIPRLNESYYKVNYDYFITNAVTNDLSRSDRNSLAVNAGQVVSVTATLKSGDTRSVYWYCMGWASRSLSSSSSSTTKVFPSGSSATYVASGGSFTVPSTVKAMSIIIFTVGGDNTYLRPCDLDSVTITIDNVPVT